MEIFFVAFWILFGLIVLAVIGYIIQEGWYERWYKPLGQKLREVGA